MRIHKHSLHHPSLPAAARPHFRLERWHRRGLYLLFAMLFASGISWLVAHYWLRMPGEFGESIHPLEHWSMQWHGALVVPVSFLTGSMLFQHMRRAHRAACNRGSGWSMLLLLFWLALTGYGLYYLASESWRPYWSSAHWLAGCALPLLLVWHIWLGRRKTAH